jgi:hypothetical protein
MRGDIPPLPHYTFMAWCLDKEVVLSSSQGQFTLPYFICEHVFCYPYLKVIPSCSTRGIFQDIRHSIAFTVSVL